VKGNLRSALRHRDFRWLWLGQSASALGDQLSVVAIAALVIGAGHGASGLRLVLAGRSLALVLFMVAGGLVGDRAQRTHVMIGADAFRVFAVGALALAPNGAPVLAFAALTFVVGAGEAFFQPAYRAVLPSLLPDEELESGNALTALARQMSFVAGPALAGVLIALASARAALWADALTFLVSLATLVVIREPLRASAAERLSIRREVAEGFRAVVDRPWIGLGIAMATSQLVFALAPWFVLLPVIATTELGGADVFGALLAVDGVGSIAGALLAARWRPRLPGVVALIALLPSGFVLLTLIGPAPLVVVGIWVLLSGVGESIFEVYWTTGIQRDVPEHLLARVFSLDYVGSLALMPLGYALTGPAVDALGRDAVLVFGTAVVLVSTLPLLAVPSVRRFATMHE
jgi:MFS family permease